MTQIETIAADFDVNDTANIESAMSKLKEVSNAELHFYLVQRDTITATSANTRTKITLAQTEFDRRQFDQTERLALKTTKLSATMGIVGTILGTILGAWLKAG